MEENAHQTTGLTRHLAEAVGLNASRMAGYGWRSRGRSILLSAGLTLIEMVLLVPGAILDLWAFLRFNHRGIAIVSEDFYSMWTVPAATEPPLYRSQASKEERRKLSLELRGFRGSVAGHRARNEFMEIARTAVALVDRLDEMERAGRYHLAMTKHLVESLGVAALHGNGYAEMSSGGTCILTRTMIFLHQRALCLAPWMDRRAQRVHALGVGILVNDVPGIPLRAELLQLHQTPLPDSNR